MAVGDIALLDTLDIDISAYAPHAAHHSGNVFVVLYATTGTGPVTIRTISVDALGNITPLDSWATGQDTYTQFIIHVAGDTFAFVYSDGAQAGVIKTFSVASDGTITKSFIATHTFAAGGAAWVWVRCEPVSCGGNVWAIGCQNSPGILIFTINISDDGVTMSTADTQAYAITQNKVMSMANVIGDIYALVTEQIINSTTLYTFEISSGAITAK
ncbi:unnamed protein product, partial [marine sediment metagenome]